MSRKLKVKYYLSDLRGQIALDEDDIKNILHVPKMKMLYYKKQA